MPAFAHSIPFSSFTPSPLPTTPLTPTAPSRPRPSRHSLVALSQYPNPAPSPPSASSPPSPSKPPYVIKTWDFNSFPINYAHAPPPLPASSTTPTLLLLHGFGANCRHFRNNLLPLSLQNWDVYAPDLLGFGLSAKPPPATLDSSGHPVSYSFDYWTLQLHSFITSIIPSTRPIFLVANSIGSMVALQLAIQYPHLVSSLVLISPSLRMLNVRKRSVLQSLTAPLLMRLLSYRPLGAYFLASLSQPAQLRRVLCQAYAVESAVDDQLIAILREPALTEGALEVFLAFIMYDTGPIPEDFLPVVTQPVCIIWGREDQFEPYNMGCELQRYKAVERFETLDGVGHCAHDESPEAVNDIIIDFVQKGLQEQQSDR